MVPRSQDIPGNLAGFLTARTGSPLGHWHGRLSAPEQRALLGRFVGKGTRCGTCHGARKALRRWSNQTQSGQNRLPPSAGRWKIRSETYPGIAAAMADQWGTTGCHVPPPVEEGLHYPPRPSQGYHAAPAQQQQQGGAL